MERIEIEGLHAATRRRGPQVIGHRQRDEAADRALTFAARLAWGFPRPLPVCVRGRTVGHVIGDGHGNGYIHPGDDPALMSWECGITQTDDIINGKIGSANYRRLHFNKSASSNMVAANWYDLWPVAGGHPLGAYAGSAFTATKFDDTSTGAVPHGGNVAPLVKVMTNAFAYTISGTNTGCFFITDRVGTYEACTFPNNVTQNMTNGVTFDRYVSAGQPGLMVSPTCQTALGGSVSNLSALAYTNVAGSSQNMPTTGAIAILNPAAAPTSSLGARVVFPTVTSASTAPASHFMPLAAGDFGVKSITSYKTSVNSTGTLCFVCHYPLSLMLVIGQATPIDADFVAPPSNLERIYDGAALDFFLLSNAAAGMSFAGNLQSVWN